MPLTLIIHRITVSSSDFIECEQTVEELRTRTSLVAHIDMHALEFISWPMEEGAPQNSTLFYPMYHARSFWKQVDIRELIKGLNLEKDEGVIFGTESSYVNQPCLGLFPRNIETTKKVFERWLRTQRFFLEEKRGIKDALTAHIKSRMRQEVSHEDDDTNL